MINWESVLQSEGPAVWRCSRRILGNDSDADECFQEAFLDAVNFSRRQTVTNWRALLIRLATARSIDRFRQRSRHERREQIADWNQLSQTDPSPLQFAQAAELSERLRAALVKIPPRQAEVFCLTCLDGWSYAETAEQLGISIDSVGVTVHRARSELRQLLACMNEVSS
jgi:RNA polymerase sigma-70 factor (ECF subfamily)